MRRRRLLQSAALAGTLSPFLLSSAHARQTATPGATPVSQEEAPDFGPNLAERVAQVDPDTLLETLRTTPVTSSLFPADTPAVEPAVWDDFGDTDLTGTLGGVVFNTGFDENDNFLGVGAAIVHPDAASASAQMAETGPAAGAFLGLAWFVQTWQDAAVSVVRIEYLLLVGGAEATIFPEDDAARLPLRAVTHTAALLNHLEGVLTELGV